MGRKLILSIVLLILVFSLVSAIDTKIKIKTLPVHKVSIFIYPSGKLAFIESAHNNSDIYGNLEVTHSSGHKDIDIIVKVSKDGEKIFLEKFDGYKAGGPISIRIDNEEITGNYAEPTKGESPGNESAGEIENEVVANESLNDSVNENEAGANGTSIAGAVISDSNNDEISRTVYYLIAGVVIVLAIVFLLYRRFSVGNLNVPVNKGSAVPVNNPNVPVNNGIALSSRTSETNLTDREVRRLRMQLTTAQREIIRLKNENRIQEIQKKIEEEKKEVDRLRRG